jgi:alpha-tubulin suppressor-like RCC1 family protein
LGLGEDTKLVTIPLCLPHVLLSYQKMIKVACGGDDSMLLSEDGIIWVTGRNHRGQGGLGHSNKVTSPEPLQYFISSGIKIIDVAVTDSHSIFLSGKINTYSVFNASRRS